jgi:Rhodopirellula transposase DDE domain
MPRRASIVALLVDHAVFTPPPDAVAHARAVMDARAACGTQVSRGGAARGQRRHHENGLVGQYANGGAEWQPAGEPVAFKVHDFPDPDPDPDPDLGEAITYGVYDLSRNHGWVSVGPTTTPPRSPWRPCAAG